MDARGLSDRALELANDGFGEKVADLVRACDGDTQALLDAAEMVRELATSAGTQEHIAFTYLSAAFDEFARRRHSA